MSAQKRMYIGMEDRVEVLADHDGRWVPERTGLEGKEVGEFAVASAAASVYAAVYGEGLFRSHDGGSTWDLVLKDDVRAVSVDPTDARTVYAGTEPVRLLRSDDDGASWTEIEGLQRMPEAVKDQWWFPQPPHEGHVKDIFVHPSDPRIIHLALEHGGIVRTFDRGETWEDVSTGIEYLDIHMVAGDPSDKSRYYAATARGFYRSDDQGKTWALSQDGMDRDYMHDFHMRMRAGEASTLYLATAFGSPPAWSRPERSASAIFRSTDGGLHWEQLAGGLPPTMKPMVSAIVSDPANDSWLYAGFGLSGRVEGDERSPNGGIWESPDQGDTWREIYPMEGAVRSLCVALS
ncbi:MAG: hypothetical protein IIC32_07070 [Chloroflexi bacterium]|nr:hypothetical protein [Chloroflexota bacterium]